MIAQMDAQVTDYQAQQDISVIAAWERRRKGCSTECSCCGNGHDNECPPIDREEIERWVRGGR